MGYQKDRFIFAKEWQYQKMFDDGIFETIEYKNLINHIEIYDELVEFNYNKHGGITFKIVKYDNDIYTYLTVPTRDVLHAIKRLLEYYSARCYNGR